MSESRQRPQMTFGGVTMKPAPSHKFLGVIVDQEHTGYAIAKGASHAMLLHCLSSPAHGISAKLIQQLYHAVAIPKMTYTASVWFQPMFNAGSVTRLQGRRDQDDADSKNGSTGHHRRNENRPHGLDRNTCQSTPHPTTHAAHTPQFNPQNGLSPYPSPPTCPSQPCCQTQRKTTPHSTSLLATRASHQPGTNRTALLKQGHSVARGPTEEDNQRSFYVNMYVVCHFINTQL